ncbi:hypothetical protein OS493_040242, partial [Desmophyllum pertusum]
GKKYGIKLPKGQPPSDPCLFSGSRKGKQCHNDKMRVLKNRMESQKSLKPKPPPTDKPTSTSMISARRRLQLTSASGAPKAHDTAFRVVDQHSSSRHQPKAVQGSPSKQSSATNRGALLKGHYLLLTQEGKQAKLTFQTF